MNPEPSLEGDSTRTTRPTAGLTARVVKGTFWTLFGLVVPILFSLFATPIVTRLLGAEGYGLFVLVLLIPTYLSFADFGMNIASTKFASEAYAERRPEAEARIVRTSALISLMGSLPPAAAMIVLSRPILQLFKVPEHLMGEAALALKLAGVIFVINFMNSIFNTPELTRLKMALNTSITSGVRLTGIIATPIVIYLGGGVVGAVAVGLCVSVITLAGHVVASSRLLPELIGFSIDRASFRPLMKFGGSLVVAGIAGVLLVNLEKFVLTRATSIETLAYYAVAATFASMLTLFSGSMAQSLMPAFSQLQGQSDRPALNALYSRGIRFTLIWLVPAAVFMILVGRPFFTHWFGVDFGRESTGPFYITVAGLFFNVLAYFPYSALLAGGRSDVFAKIYWAELLPYIFLVWWLSHRFGANGAAAAWSIRVIFDSTVLFWLAKKVGVSFIHYRLLPFVLAALVMASPLALIVFFNEMTIEALGMFAGCGIIYGLVVWTRVLRDEEVKWIKQVAGSYFVRPNR